MTENFTPGTASWIDLGSTDLDGASAFYGALFGWEAEDLGPESGGYRLFRLAGKQVGGLGPATDPERGTSWSVYFDTADAEDSAAKVAANGGQVIVPPMDVMGKGIFAVFTDPAGAFFSVWQAGEHKGAEITQGHGTLAWAELYSTDLPAAQAFYPKVLPVTAREIGGDSEEVQMKYTLLEVGDQAVAGAMESPDEVSRWGVYFEVDNVDVTADQALTLGATELFRQDSPPGRMASLIDPQGGIFCIITSNPDFRA